jgi:thiopeptide-type bacteriocin biosynthesis protein
MEEISRIAGQAEEHTEDLYDFIATVRQGETIGVSRKKVLLRLLAGREGERLGIAVDAQQLGNAVEVFRRRFGLLDEGDFEFWLATAGIDRPTFNEFMHGVTLVDLVEAHFDEEIRRELPLQRKAQTVYAWQSGDLWAQFNVRLARDKGGAAASAVRLFDRLWPLVAPGRRPTAMRRFFMMRKPPDLRIRLAGPDIEALTRPVKEVMAGLEREGVVVQWYIVPYEPELFRFGNQRILEIVHEWFDADSLAWLRWEPLELRRGNRISREVISLVVLNDLLFTVLQDEAEVWDVWRRVALQHGFEPDESVKSGRMVSIAGLKQLTDPAEGEILECYERANRVLWAGIEAAAQQGNLALGPRSLLATMILFHWNRYGFSIEARRRILGQMLVAFDPHGPESVRDV